MQPVTLTIIIVSGTHLHKTVVNTKSVTGTYGKGKDELPNWIVSTASQRNNPEVGSVQSIIRNWDDGSNNMFSFAPGSPEEIIFKNSKRGTHIKKIPKFSTSPTSDLATSISFCQLVLTPMSLAFDAMLNQVPVGVVQSINEKLIQFITRYRSDSNLLGHGLWEENFNEQISTEL